MAFERDLDNLLVEELWSSEAFRSWFVSLTPSRFVAPEFCTTRVGKSPQRLQDNWQTDVQIVWYVSESCLKLTARSDCSLTK